MMSPLSSNHVPSHVHRGALPRCREALGLLTVVMLLAGCGYYSFTGATLPESVETVAVPLADVRAPGVPPTLDQALTEAFVERFADRTRLTLNPDQVAADAVVRTTVERYGITPAAVTGDEVAALNRVTLGVRVVFEQQAATGPPGTTGGEPRLNRVFTATADYDPNAGQAGELEAVGRALDQVADDAFTAATSDW